MNIELPDKQCLLVYGRMSSLSFVQRDFDSVRETALGGEEGVENGGKFPSN